MLTHVFRNTILAAVAACALASIAACQANLAGGGAQPSSTPSGTAPTETRTTTVAPGDQSLGTDDQIRNAALIGPHPGLKACAKGLLVREIARSAAVAHTEYAAVLTTCKDASGGAPTDVAIVEPYAQGQPTLIYAVVDGFVNHDPYQLIAEHLQFTGNQLTITYSGFAPGDPDTKPSQQFIQTDTIATNSFTKGGYTSHRLTCCG
ncbi:hypothetical protein [Amycolatopsis sp. SID8362]|uniref:hypothetical protein n=1 Tax=Amycolatopsis sp. SID8362 TaxID=2690346 RepID=UPI00136EA59C|nr:hypothetical protein [Amycolatopsis sp. SID8362]NBH09516.1 hypothetical protein [Amycolatopsis sp. SID8362]NED46208.1 hypothetical protein [Amycolatopsis sp. SID8362]